MLAWSKWGKGQTPESTGIKGDRLVGDFYVMFDKENKKEVEQLISEGHSGDDLAQKTPLMEEALLTLFLITLTLM